MLRWAVCSSAARTLGPSSRWTSLSRLRHTLESATADQKPLSLRELAIPDESSDALIPSDFQQYLAPLYSHGWQYAIDRQMQDPKWLAHRALRRKLSFQDRKSLVAFTANTRDLMHGSIAVLRNGEVYINFHSPTGVTRSIVRSAVQTEIAYINTHDSEPQNWPHDKTYHLMSEQEISQQEDLPKPSRYSTKVFARALIKPVRLPPPPPAPAFPPPALTDADLKTYMKPLIKNGWRICNPRIRHREARMALMGYPSLHRVYRFTDYHAARHFLHTAVAAMPLPTHATLAGAEVRLSDRLESTYVVQIRSISELAPGSPRQYGISLADVRFAIEIENEVATNWVGRTDNCGSKNRHMPKTMDEVWKYYSTRPETWSQD